MRPQEHALVAAEIGCLVVQAAKIEAAIDQILFLMVEALEEVVLKVAHRFPTSLTEKTEVLYAVTLVEPLSSEPEIAKFHLSLPREHLDQLFLTRNIVCHGKLRSVQGSSDGFLIQSMKVNRPRKVDGKQMVGYRHHDVSSTNIREQVSCANQIFRHLDTVRLQVWRRLKGWPRFLAEHGEGPFSAESALSFMDSLWSR